MKYITPVPKLSLSKSYLYSAFFQSRTAKTNPNCHFISSSTSTFYVKKILLFSLIGNR